MSNYLDYLKWRGDLSFTASPFCEIDALILCELIYMKTDGIVSPEFKFKGIDVARLCKHFTLTREPKNSLDESLHTLANTVLESPRIADIKVCGYVDEFDPRTYKQFAAATFKINKGLYFVCFRGTDETLVGWRENMDLAYHEEIPSQKAALNYLNKVTKELKGKFIVGGHSKGGNLAVYATAFSYKRASNLVKTVYNFDGPGFNDKVISKPSFRDITDKVHTYVPQNSLIGLLLKHKEDFTVIKSSKTSGLSEHQLDTWEVNVTEIQKEADLQSMGKFLNENIQEWIDSMSYETKEQFIITAFSLLDENMTVDDLLTPKNIAKIMKEYSNLDKEKKGNISAAMGNLSDTVFDNIKGLFDGWFE